MSSSDRDKGPLASIEAHAPVGVGIDILDSTLSTVATGVISLRTTLVPVILGVVAGPTQVGLFRIAQTPLTGLAAASSPARLVLLTEQTREWERGRQAGVLAGVRKYTIGATAVMVVAVPVFFLAMPWLVEAVFGDQYTGAVDAARIVLLAAAIQFAIGWTKTLPVTSCSAGMRRSVPSASSTETSLAPSSSSAASAAPALRLARASK